MERITYRKTLDVHKNGVQFTLQGFTTQDNMSRVIEISLMSSGDTIDFPLDRITAMMYTLTPGAEVADVDSCEMVGNKVVYVVPRIPIAGITKMTVQLIETDVNGAKSTYCTPQFAVEVMESDADNEPAEKTPSFTALLDSTARAKQVYDQRFERMEFLEDGTFNAYYADGTVYTNTALAKFIVDTASGGEVDWSAVVSNVTSTITAKEVAPEVKTMLDAQYSGKWGKAEYVGDLEQDFPTPMFVMWDANTAGTPYTAGITEKSSGFALVYGTWEAVHTTVAWVLGEDKPAPYIRVSNNGEGGWRKSNGMIDLENDTTGLLPISSGGTGAGNSADARENLNVYSKDEVNSYQKPWDIKDNIGHINAIEGSFKVRAEAGETAVGVYNIPMINSGIIYLKALHYNESYRTIVLKKIEIKKNEETLQSYEQDFPRDRLIPIEVTKGDIITIEATVTSTDSSNSQSIEFDEIYLVANIDTPYKYVEFKTFDIPK